MLQGFFLHFCIGIHLIKSQDMTYIAVDFTLGPAKAEDMEILIGLLDMHGFEGIEEKSDGLTAYISAEEYEGFDLRILKEGMNRVGCEMSLKTRELKDKNWNEVWERNFEPVIIGTKCVVRAPFHTPREGVEIDIVIEPKMSFGTGHHLTTRMMMEMLLTLQPEGKTILDMGCGTGVLAILAGILGAEKVIAIDNDSWAYENSLENVERNHVENVEVRLGDKESIPDLFFDIIMANINTNILLDQVSQYAAHQRTGGLLLLSGIMRHDSHQVREASQSYGYIPEREFQSDEWVMMLFTRK